MRITGYGPHQHCSNQEPTECSGWPSGGKEIETISEQKEVSMNSKKRFNSRIVLYLIVALLIGIFMSPKILTQCYQAGAGQVLLEHHDYSGVEALEQSIMKQARSEGMLCATLSVLGAQLPFWVLLILTFETMSSPSGKKKKILTGCYWFTWFLGMAFFSFFIPYFLADFHFPKSVMLSVSIYIAFSVTIAFIYMILKYLLVLVKRINSTIKKNSRSNYENFLYRRGGECFQSKLVFSIFSIMVLYLFFTNSSISNERGKPSISAFPQTASADTAIGFDFAPVKIAPRQIIDKNWKLFDSHFHETTTNLRSRNLSVNDHNRKLEQLQAEYDDAYLRYKSRLNKLEQIQELVDAGIISPENGYRAQWRIALPDEMYHAMFP
jgi:hypothetical protein